MHSQLWASPWVSLWECISDTLVYPPHLTPCPSLFLSDINFYLVFLTSPPPGSWSWLDNSPCASGMSWCESHWHCFLCICESMKKMLKKSLQITTLSTCYCPQRRHLQCLDLRCLWRKYGSFWLFIYFWWNEGLNSGSYTCQVGVLPLEPLCQPFVILKY